MNSIHWFCTAQSLIISLFTYLLHAPKYQKPNTWLGYIYQVCCIELVAKWSLYVCVKKGQGLEGDKILYCALFLMCFIVCALIAIETSLVFLPTDKLKLILESILGVATVYSLSRVLKRVHLVYHVIRQSVIR